MNVSGPVFLVFYSLLAVAANLLLRRYFRACETPATLPRLEHADDPYRVACLRGGPAAAVQVALVSLVDRGLLEERGGEVRLADPASLDYELRPFEKQILQACRDWATPATIEGHPAVRAAGGDYERRLAERSLLAGSATFSSRFGAYLTAMGLMLGIAVARILQALSHGRTNIGFLVVLALLCAFGLYRAYRRRRTGQGDAVLARLERLFAHLKRNAGRIVPGGRDQDLAILAAVFGPAALPRDAFGFVDRLYPRKKGDGGDSGGGGDGGGGCGGSGCGGGGCGGCGG